MKKLILAGTIVMGSVWTLQAQDSLHVHEGHNHAEEHSHGHKNEISIATGVVPLVYEDEISVGFHLHYVRGLGDDKRVGVGIGLETIIDEHKHYTVSTVLQYRIYKGWTLAYAPGLLMRKENSKMEFGLAQHVETGYEFELNKFHLGPVFEIGFEPGGLHYMGGIHFGIDF